MIAEEKWRNEAACKGMDPDIFHPEAHDTKAVFTILDICRACPVRVDCLKHAIASGEREGWWGGMSPRKRRTILTTMNRVPNHGTRKRYELHLALGEDCYQCRTQHTARVRPFKRKGRAA